MTDSTVSEHGFADLAKLRAELKDAVVHHEASVSYFLDPESGAFFRTLRHHDSEMANREAVYELDLQDVPAPEPEHAVDPDELEDEQQPERKVRQLTTTFTCVESLADAGADAEESVRLQTQAYVALALDHPDDWASESAARIYCRVRSLAPLLQVHGNTLSDEHRAAANSLLLQAWSGVEARPGCDGIFEVGGAGNTTDFAAMDLTKIEVEDRYPPNAYLTYWGIASLQQASQLGIISGELDARREIAGIWLEKSLGTQVALHVADSRRCDPQQIAWSICGLVRLQAESLAERPTPASDLVAGALRVFFERQEPNGTWPRGEPLFHYPTAGNAYCYPFETLAELLNLALAPGAQGTELRQMLRPYARQLEKAFRLALMTSRPLSANFPGLGWCSEHHPHRRSPESWATAAVFRFMQALRRLVGIWAREHAAIALTAREPAENLETLRARGDTWNVGSGSVGLQLASLFVHPILATASRGRINDPDVAALDQDLARSAMLFGPPGTGKTTYVEAVAGALGWKFIEITPADFLDSGVDMVSARADEVFRMLMELDHCVVLFDEIDELIRLRNASADPLERFFTTTMLPRLTKLWKRANVMFFVNTNSIAHVDPAVRRSQRFDAAIFVLPPSARTKQNMLGDGLVTDADVEVALDVASGNMGKHPEEIHGLGWLPFIRFDQLARLKLNLQADGGDTAAAFTKLGREVYESDWTVYEPVAPPNGDPPPETEVAVGIAIAELKKLSKFERRDDSRARYIEVDPAKDLTPPAGATVEGTKWWRVESNEDDLSKWADQHGLQLDSGASVVT